MHSVDVYRSVVHVARDTATMRQTDRTGQKEAAMWTEAADYSLQRDTLPREAL